VTARAATSSVRDMASEIAFLTRALCRQLVIIRLPLTREAPSLALLRAGKGPSARLLFDLLRTVAASSSRGKSDGRRSLVPERRSFQDRPVAVADLRHTCYSVGYLLWRDLVTRPCPWQASELRASKRRPAWKVATAVRPGGHQVVWVRFQRPCMTTSHRAQWPVNGPRLVSSGLN
jgi:hypothetical protein